MIAISTIVTPARPGRGWYRAGAMPVDSALRCGRRIRRPAHAASIDPTQR